jgi:triacylglycerol lipase
LNLGPPAGSIGGMPGHAPAHAAQLAVLALAACLVAALVAGWFWWRRFRARRAVRRRAPQLRHPVVLAHGFLGFDEVVVAGVKHEYFRDITRALAEHAHTSHRARVAPAGSVASRAEELARCIRALPDKRVNVIAHSMGGLDARHAITRLGLERRVASLTTIGCPHRGTPIADLGVVMGERLGLRRVLERLRLPLEALDDLTTAAMAEFNRSTPDARGVAYASVVGAAPARRTHPLLVPGNLYLQGVSGENDGLVPAESQRWGEVLCRIEADHWAQVGWSKHFDVAAFYDGLLRELRGRGL